MAKFRLEPAADRRLDELFDYSLELWGEEQAVRYLAGLFQRFQEIADGTALSRMIPATMGVSGHVCRYERHLIYWTNASDGQIAIATILHERMHHARLLREAFEP